MRAADVANEGFQPRALAQKGVWMIVGDAHRDIPRGVRRAVGNCENRQVAGTRAARRITRRHQIKIMPV